MALSMGSNVHEGRVPMESMGFEISTPDRHDSLPSWGDHGLISDGDMVQKRRHLHSNPCTPAVQQCSAVPGGAVQSTQSQCCISIKAAGRCMRAEEVGRAYRACQNLTVGAKALKYNGEEDPSFSPWPWPAVVVVAVWPCGRRDRRGRRRGCWCRHQCECQVKQASLEEAGYIEPAVPTPTPTPAPSPRPRPRLLLRSRPSPPSPPSLHLAPPCLLAPC